jgi:hypothetical protein
MATKKAAKKSVKKNVEKEVVTLDRRREDRRTDDADAVDAIADPRRKKQRRRHIDPTTCERDYNDQEIEFMRAMDDYKHASGRMFPTCSEVLEVIRNLGYVQLNADQIDEFGLGMDDESATLEDCEEELTKV